MEATDIPRRDGWSYQYFIHIVESQYLVHCNQIRRTDIASNLYTKWFSF